MHHALGNALAIKMRHLFEKQEIFKYNRSARTYCKGVLVVTDWPPGIRRHFSFVFGHKISSVSCALNEIANPSHHELMAFTVVAQRLYFQYILQIKSIGIAY